MNDVAADSLLERVVARASDDATRFDMAGIQKPLGPVALTKDVVSISECVDWLPRLRRFLRAGG